MTALGGLTGLIIALILLYETPDAGSTDARFDGCRTNRNRQV